MKNTRHRVRSLVTPRRDPNIDAMDNIIQTMEGKNNPEPREMPRIDEDQAIRALMVDAMREPCFLDQQGASVVEIYHVPEGLNLLGQKFILYSLCECCRLDITAKPRAESMLVNRLRSENGQSPIEMQ